MEIILTQMSRIFFYQGFHFENFDQDVPKKSYFLPKKNQSVKNVDSQFLRFNKP